MHVPSNFRLLTSQIFGFRDLYFTRPVVIDADTQPDFLLSPSRDASLPKVFIKPAESRCWEVMTEEDCNSTVFCPSCQGTDRLCHWRTGSDFYGPHCGRRAPTAVKEYFRQESQGSGYSQGCPVDDRSGYGFSLSSGMRFESGGSLVRGLGIVGFGRRNLNTGYHAGILSWADENRYGVRGSTCAGTYGSLVIEGCYIESCYYAGVIAYSKSSSNGDPDFQVVIRPSLLRSSKIIGNHVGVQGVALEQLSRVANISLDRTLISGNVDGSHNISISPLKVNSGAGIVVYQGSSLEVVSSSFTRLGRIPSQLNGVLLMHAVFVSQYATNTRSSTINIKDSAFYENNLGVFIHDNTAAYTSIENVTISNNMDIGLYVGENMQSTRLIGLTYSNHSSSNSEGVRLKSTSLLTDCSFVNNVGTALTFYSGASNSVISESKFISNAQPGSSANRFALYAASNNISVAECQFKNNGNGIKFIANNSFIMGVNLSNTFGTAISAERIVGSTARAISGVTVEGCNLYGGGVGLFLGNVENFEISDTSVSNFSGNREDSGVSLNGNQGIIRQVAVSGVTGHGIYVNGANISVVSVVVSRCSLDGIYFAPGSYGTVNGLQSTPTVVTANSRHGIHVDNSDCRIGDDTYIGLDPRTATPCIGHGNGQYGVFFDKEMWSARDSSAIVGTAQSIPRIAISGNVGGGVVLTTDNVAVSGVMIGTNTMGSSSVHCGQSFGLAVFGSNSTIGTDTSTTVISNNFGPGIIVAGSHTTIQNSMIGLDARGASSVGNGGYGIWLLPEVNGTVLGAPGMPLFIGSTQPLTEQQLQILAPIGLSLTTEANGIGIMASSFATVSHCHVGVSLSEISHLMGNGGAGIVLTDGGVVRSSVVGNNQGSGIVSTSSSELTIMNSHIGVYNQRNCSNFRYGLEVDVDSPANISVANSSFSYNGFAGIRIGNNAILEQHISRLNYVDSGTNSWRFAFACEVCA